MFKNVASQSIALFAFTPADGLPKTGDAANMLFYITKDWGTVTAVAANSAVPTEMDATNAPGWYKIAVSQTESNADAVLLTGKSSTAGVKVVGQLVQTLPAAMAIVAGAAGGLFIAGTNAATTITTGLTTTFTGSLTGSVASVSGAVGSIASGGIAAASFASGAINAAAIAANAIGASQLASDAANEIADAFLDRDMSTGVDSGSTTIRTPRQGLRALRNKVSTSGGVLTVTKEDDSTSSWTATLTTDSSALPITVVDPAGP